MIRKLAFGRSFSPSVRRLFAQRTTGSISGVVKDATGSVLPGATVSVSGPNVSAPRRRSPTSRASTASPAPSRRVRGRVHPERLQDLTARGLRVGVGSRSKRTPAWKSARSRSRSTWWRRRRSWTRLPTRSGPTTTATGWRTRPCGGQLPRPRGRRAGLPAGGRRQRPDHGLRLVLRRELLPARRRRHHRQLLQRVLRRAEHRCHRGGRGPVPGRSRRVRQPHRRRLQHRDPPGHERVPRRRELLLPIGRPDFEQQQGLVNPDGTFVNDVRRRAIAAHGPATSTTTSPPSSAARSSRTSSGSSAPTSTSATRTRTWVWTQRQPALSSGTTTIATCSS